MTGQPEPAWYLDHVLVHASPGGHSRIEIGPAAEWRSWWTDHVRTDDPLRALATTQGFAVTTEQLRRCGWANHDLRRAVRRNEWSVPTRGTASPIVVTGTAWLDDRRRHALQAAAKALLRPGQTVSGRSAAVLHGLPTFVLPAVPELTASGVRLGGLSSVSTRGATLTAAEIDSWFGTPVTAIARTLVDLARHDRRDAIMAADAALRERLIDRASITSALGCARGWPGVSSAREVLALADPLAESPLESLTRLALHDDGFPQPRLQMPVIDPARRYPWRVDLMWPSARLVLECDGLAKYSDAEARRERLREARLRALGYRIERVTWAEVVHDWPATSARIRLALAN